MNPTTQTFYNHFVGPMIALVGVLLSVASLYGDTLVYEGFQLDSAERSSRNGLSGQWGLFEGEAVVADADISFPGLESTHGLMQLRRDTVTVCQMGELSGDVIYGSFRIYNETIVEDALLGIAICEPDSTQVKPDTARMSLLVKGWRVDHGVVTAQGRKKKAQGGMPLRAGEAYLILFKAVNPGSEDGSLTMWALNAAQVESIRAGGFDERALSTRSVGIQAGEVFQRVSLVLPKDKAPMIESGLMICLISRFNQGTLIDEIRISGANLSVAAGEKTATETAVKGIPYISK